MLIYHEVYFLGSFSNEVKRRWIRTKYIDDFLFVRDGILSVADYNSTRVGVVVVVVVMAIFTMG